MEEQEEKTTRNTRRKKLFKTIEEQGWSVAESEHLIELSNSSPVGEDLTFGVERGSVKKIIEEIKKYAEDFDTEEHVNMWVEAKVIAGVGGVPTSKELVKDADDIKEMLGKLAEAVEKLI